LIEDHGLIPKAIEESLRIDSPVLHLARPVAEDTVLNLCGHEGRRQGDGPLRRGQLGRAGVSR
jgi:hypothetical protein